MCSDREFQVEGAETEKAREDVDSDAILSARRFVLEERKDLDERND